MRNRQLFVSNVTLTGSICLTVFFIYCVCLFPFAKFFFFHLCCATTYVGENKVVYIYITGWRRGVVVSGVRRMNEVNARWARLVPGWVTAFRRVYRLGMQQAN